MSDQQHTEISALGEFGLIDRLTEGLTHHNASTLKGVGDDGAVLEYKDSEVLVTTDLLLEGIHFDLTYVPLKHLGYKAAVVNFSDIYAMNGRPRQITVSLGISKRFTVEHIEVLYSGIKLACEIYGVDLIGGDTTSSRSGLVISITCIGDAPKGKIVYRDGAKDTDLICVSGDLGAAYMGLQLLEREKVASAGQKDFVPNFAGKEYLVERQLKPEARRDIIEELDKADIHDGCFGRIVVGVTAYLQAEPCRMPCLRRPDSDRLSDGNHGRGIEYESGHSRPKRWRGLRVALYCTSVAARCY